MKSTEINDVMNNSPVNTLGFKIKQNKIKPKTKHPNFKFQYTTFYTL